MHVNMMIAKGINPIVAKEILILMIGGVPKNRQKEVVCVEWLAMNTMTFIKHFQTEMCRILITRYIMCILRPKIQQV
jgi:hypothetical protein